ncbi:MAG: hypothetical protein ACI9YL_002265, partial [Luteibaculaceae bacterium]
MLGEIDKMEAWGLSGLMQRTVEHFNMGGFTVTINLLSISGQFRPRESLLSLLSHALPQQT